MRRLARILFLLSLLTGVLLLLYPTLSDAWNAQHQTRAIAVYSEEIASLDTASQDAMWESAQAYNERLYEEGSGSLTLTEEAYEVYEAELDVTGTGIMCYLEIPAIDVYLPVYHGTGAGVLQVAIGHIEGTSLPVGGAGTHAVLSGHTGLASARLFTDLDQLEIGDLFLLHTLGRTLTYEVDQILVVLPDETEELRIREGEDLVTLVTCTPYGVNTHRLLVRGHRVANAVTETAVTLLEGTGEVLTMGNLILLLTLAALTLAVIILILALALRRQDRHRRCYFTGYPQEGSCGTPPQHVWSGKGPDRRTAHMTGTGSRPTGAYGSTAGYRYPAKRGDSPAGIRVPHPSAACTAPRHTDRRPAALLAALLTALLAAFAVSACAGCVKVSAAESSAALSPASSAAEKDTMAEEARIFTLTIRMEYDGCPVSGGEFALYRIGEGRQEGEEMIYERSDAFSGSGIDLEEVLTDGSAAVLESAAAALAEYAQENAVSPDLTAAGGTCVDAGTWEKASAGTPSADGTVSAGESADAADGTTADGTIYAGETTDAADESADAGKSAVAAEGSAEPADAGESADAAEGSAGAGEGEIVITGLPAGIYLLVQTESADGFCRAAPFLVCALSASAEAGGSGIGESDLSACVKLSPDRGDTEEPEGTGVTTEPESPGAVLIQTGTMRWVSVLLLLAGAVLFAAAAALILFHRWEDRQAGEAAASLLEEVTVTADLSDTRPDSGSAAADIPQEESILGTLCIPSLGLELPVYADWSYEKLRTAPCRYAGSPEDGNLVIAGHNYDSHFGSLGELCGGEEVIFTAADGTAYRYTVDAVEILPPDAVEEMTQSGYPLTLYTCTWGGASRITVRCTGESGEP